MQKAIVESLANLDKEFHVDELAYLALTTKIEMPIRDRWAFLLYKNLVNENLIVSREWKRTDLALLKNQFPESLIELKAMYSFDAALDPIEVGGYIDAMAKDEIKATKLAVTGTEIYTVLLATHPEQIPSNYTGIIKYNAYINKAIRKFGSANEVKSQAITAVNNKLSSKNIILSGELFAGCAFGVKTSILYWVVKA